MKEATKDFGTVGVILLAVIGFLKEMLKKTAPWMRFVISIIIILAILFGAFLFFKANPRVEPEEYSFLVTNAYAQESTEGWIYIGELISLVSGPVKDEVWVEPVGKAPGILHNKKFITTGQKLTADLYEKELPIRDSYPSLATQRGWKELKTIGKIKDGDQFKVLEIKVVENNRVWLRIKK